ALCSCTDPPAASVETDFMSVHVWVKCGADLCNDPSASRLLRLMQDPDERSELREVVHPLLLSKCSGSIDGLDVDLSPATLLQNARDSCTVRECQPTRRAGFALLATVRTTNCCHFHIQRPPKSLLSDLRG